MYCPKCEVSNPDNAEICNACKSPLINTGIPVSQKNSSLAIASLVLGCLGIVIWFLPLPGLIVGIIALNQIKNSNGQLGGRNLALAGTIISAVFLVFSVVVMAIFFLGFGRGLIF